MFTILLVPWFTFIARIAIMPARMSTTLFAVTGVGFFSSLSAVTSFTSELPIDESSRTIPTRLSSNQSFHHTYDDDISDEGEIPIPYSEYSGYNQFGPQITTVESTGVWWC